MRRALIGLIVFVVCSSAPLAWAQPATARDALRMRLPEVRLENVALSECVDFLRDISQANIHVNWRALESIGITRETPVNLNLRNVSLRTAMRLMMSQADPTNGMTFYIDDDVLEITTRELADSRLLTRVYPVDDLLMVIPDFTEAPDFNLEATQSTGSRSSGGGGSGSGRSGGGAGGGRGLFGNQGSEREETVSTESERADELILLIQDLIQPDIWRENGGVATIRYFNGSLIVTAPRSVHEAIGGPIN